jgi:transcriptional regulator with XRE-family HTH domain
MAENRISHLRKLRKLTQRALAERVGTSQQQIQRIESGTQAARLDLAASIAEALKVPLAELFPKLPKIPTKRNKKPTKGDAESVAAQFLNAGIDPDPVHWTLKFGLTSGPILLYTVASQEKERISNILRRSQFDFVVFHTNDKCVAIRRNQINFCQFLFDVGVVRDETEDDPGYELEAFFVGGEHFTFEVEPDTIPWGEDDYGGGSELQRLFVDLESGIEVEEVLSFDDADGERVYLRVRQLLRVELPLVCCEPELWKNHIENWSEHGEAEGQAANEGLRRSTNDDGSAS